MYYYINFGFGIIKIGKTLLHWQNEGEISEATDRLSCFSVKFFSSRLFDQFYAYLSFCCQIWFFPIQIHFQSRKEMIRKKFFDEHFFRLNKILFRSIRENWNPVFEIWIERYGNRIERNEMKLRIDCLVYEYRFPSLFAVDRDWHFGPRILNSHIKSPILTGKLLFWTLFVDVNKRIRR